MPRYNLERNFNVDTAENDRPKFGRRRPGGAGAARPASPRASRRYPHGDGRGEGLSQYRQYVLQFADILARAKRERVVQSEVEKANRRPTDPTRPDRHGIPRSRFNLNILGAHLLVENLSF